MKIFQWVLSIAVAVILLQTLFFKFSGAEESVYIFSTLGIEPWGRIGSGLVELVASIFLLWPTYRWVGALLAAGTMLGAIASHLFVLGIVVQNDGGTLFFLAVLVEVMSLVVFWFNKNSALSFINKISLN